MRTGQKLSTGSAVVEQQQVSLPNNHFDFDDVDVLDNNGDNDHDDNGDNGDNDHDDNSDKMMTKWRNNWLVLSLPCSAFLQKMSSER